jgi:hypothetical protein
VFSNTAPDQTVTLTQGGATTITGTYPNFTITSTDTTYTAGGGIGLTTTEFSVTAGSGLTQDADGLSHADTSSQASIDNSGATFVQDINLDGFGHVTGAASVTVTPSLIGAPQNDGTGATGTWGISISGNAATASTATTLTGLTSTVAELNILDGVTATAAELNFVDGVTSNVQTQLNAKADLASPALTGTPTAPTAAVTTNTTQIATTAFVNAEIANDAPTKTGGGASGTWDIAISGNATTATTATTANALNTANDYRVDSLGVGTNASGTTGEIRATNNVTAYYSDDRLKTRFANIDDPIGKVMSLSGFYYEANEVAQALGYEVKQEVGVSAQEVQAVMPEVVAPAPIDEQYLTVRYERLVPLLIEAIKAQQVQIDELKSKLKD